MDIQLRVSLNCKYLYIEEDRIVTDSLNVTEQCSNLRMGEANGLLETDLS